jgi:hypothetical protein
MIIIFMIDIRWYILEKISIIMKIISNFYPELLIKIERSIRKFIIIINYNPRGTGRDRSNYL